MKIINATDKNRSNCVLWLRDRLPSLPYGLWTLDDKKAIINSQEPVVGSGAMSKDGVWFTHNGKRVFSGHVALVTKVEGDIITIREANYKSCTITEREGTMAQLKLVGFFVPPLIINEEPMDIYKDTISSTAEMLDFDYGDNLNENESKKMVKKIKQIIQDNEDIIKLNQDQVKLIKKLEEENTIQKEIIDELHKEIETTIDKPVHQFKLFGFIFKIYK